MVNFIDGLDGLVAGRRRHRQRHLLPLQLHADPHRRPDELLQPRLADLGHHARRMPRLPAAELASRQAVHGRRGRPAGRAAHVHLGDQRDRRRSTRSSSSSATGPQFAPAFLPLLLPFAILIVPLLDFSLAVVRRLARRQEPVQRRPQAPPPPPARHGPHPLPRDADLLRVDRGHLGRVAAVLRRPSLLVGLGVHRRRPAALRGRDARAPQPPQAPRVRGAEQAGGHDDDGDRGARPARQGHQRDPGSGSGTHEHRRRSHLRHRPHGAAPRPRRRHRRHPRDRHRGRARRPAPRTAPAASSPASSAPASPSSSSASRSPA